MIVLHTDAVSKVSLVMAQNYGPTCVHRGQVLNNIWSENLKAPFGYDPRRSTRTATIELVPHVEVSTDSTIVRCQQTEFEYSWIGFENYDDGMEGGYSIPLANVDTYLLGMYGKWKLRYCNLSGISIIYESMQHYFAERTLTYLVRCGYCPHHGFASQNVEEWGSEISDYVKIRCAVFCRSGHDSENPDYWWMNPHFKGDLEKGRFVLRKFMEWSAAAAVPFRVGRNDPKSGQDVDIYIKPEYATLFKVALC